MAKSCLPLKSLFVVLSALVNLGLSAQTIEYLNSNNVKAGIGIGGALFMNKDYNPNSPNTTDADLFESPVGWGRDEIFMNVSVNPSHFLNLL